MSALYPSLEDLKVDQAIQAQASATPRMPTLPVQETAVSQPSVLYPNLKELENYMGLSLSSQEVQQNLPQIPEGASAQASATTRMPTLPVQETAVSQPSGAWTLTPPSGVKKPCRLLAPAEKCVLEGLFVQLVQANTPASLVGLRFGDQILQIDGRDCAGWSTDKAHRVVKRASAEKIIMVVRDRPFQRTVTMHKDSKGHIGFVIKKGKVVSVVKGSSAARNGLVTNHCMCEVNGQNVIGLKDKEVTEILAKAGNVVTLTIIPTVIFEHMVKKLSPTLLHHTMDHSIPDV
ncbi:syntenin-2 [Pteropus vampyrus]|uniref:Syntenin-2 n=1 Tax=Pteropus vampyrus TaxID=132908 RepID=A0A6P3RK90_PTEVA|nr:syntenin-2 [Pteropus vampyrus]